MPLEGDSNFKVKKELLKGTELKGKTLGIMVFGRIGRAAKIALGIGMNVIYNDKFIAQHQLVGAQNQRSVLI